MDCTRTTNSFNWITKTLLGFHGKRYQHYLSVVRNGEKYSTEGSITVNNDEKRANN